MSNTEVVDTEWYLREQERNDGLKEWQDKCVSFNKMNYKCPTCNGVLKLCERFPTSPDKFSQTWLGVFCDKDCEVNEEIEIRLPEISYKWKGFRFPINGRFIANQQEE
jgi:hypothetical protein